MESRRALARRLEDVEDFANPRVDLEQYPTPAEIAAHLLHRARLHDDLRGRPVADLGTGTGILAIGAATAAPSRVIGIDVDADALAVARRNETRVGTDTRIDWIRGDAANVPLRVDGATVLSNPPFGARQGNRHADRAFLETASDVASVSYTIHNEDSRTFVESFADDAGGEVTHAFRASFDLERRFDFHETDRRRLDAELFRIEWATDD